MTSFLKKLFTKIVLFTLLCSSIGGFPVASSAATLLSDDFTGTTIDASKWTVVDAAGTNITQNGALTVANSYSGTWGNTALLSADTFAREGLSISAKLSPIAGQQLLAYGDYQFQSGGSQAYMIDISTALDGAAVYALSWEDGVFSGNLGCGTATAGATYTLSIVEGGFEVYKDTGSGDVLLCSVSANPTLTNKRVFLESELSASYDDILVENAAAATEPAAIDDLAATAGVSEVALAWSAPSNGGDPITDYSVDYRESGSPGWTSFVHAASTVTTSTVTGLTNGTTYDFRVRAVNGIGTAADSNIATSTPFALTAPSRPLSVTAVADSQMARISFTAPTTTGGSAITGYTVTASPGGATASRSASPIVVSGLTNGVAYTFTVAATNAIGTGASSTASNEVTPATSTPLTIDGLTLWLDASDVSTIATSSDAVTQIDDKSGTGNDATAAGALSPTLIEDARNGNSVMRFDGSNYLSIAPTITYRTIFVVAKFSAASFDAYNGLIGDVSGLSTNSGHILNGVQGTAKLSTVGLANFAEARKNGTVVAGSGGHDFSPINGYWIGSFELPANVTNINTTIGALNGDASWLWDGDIAEVLVYDEVLSDLDRTSLEAYLSSKWNITVAAPPTLADAIADLVALATGPSSVGLSWTAPSDGGSEIVDYEVDYRTTGSGGWSSFIHSVSTAAAQTVTGLIGGTGYDFRVRAVNGMGTGTNSNIATATTDAATVPSAPTIGSATAGDGQASVTFTASTSTGGSAILSYQVTSSPGGVTASSSTSPITVTGLMNGTDYTFTVRALNAVGYSASSSASNSVTVHAIPTPDQVTGATVTGVNKQALLGWTAPDDGGESAISDYLIEYKLASTSTWSTFSHSASTSTKITVTGLTNDEEYDFRVSAVNAGGAGTASATVSATPAPIGSLAFVFTGESSSGGIGANASATLLELSPRSAVQIMNLTSGDFLFEDLDIGTNNLRDHAGLEAYYDTSHGYELELANSVVAGDFPDNSQVYLTKTGQGGSVLSEWNVGGPYWTKFLQRTAAAKTQIPSPRQWVVWYSLGANDGVAGTASSTIRTETIAHINKIKADLPGAIIIVAQYQSLPGAVAFPYLDDVLAQVAASEPNVFAIDTTGAQTVDEYHWTYSGLKLVTSRYVTATKDALGLNTPGRPTSLVRTPSSTQMALSWTAPEFNGGAAITDYAVEYKASTSTVWATFADGVSTTAAATVTGLDDNTGYDFRVSAVNSDGTGNPVSGSATTTDATAPVISSTSATAGSTTSTVAWTTDEIASSRVEYGLTSSYGTSTSVADTSPRVLSHAVSLTNLVACTTYHYRVHSIDGSANAAAGSDRTFTTSGCTGSAAVVAEAASSITTAAGGSIELLSGGKGIELGVPSAFSETDVEFQVKQLDVSDATESTGVPSGYLTIGSYLYDMKAFDEDSALVTSFDAPLTVTVSYGAADVSGMNESSLRIYRWDGSEWGVLSSCTVDTSLKTVTCLATHFSIFGLFGQVASASSPAPSSGPSSGGSNASRYGCKDPKALNYEYYVIDDPRLCRYTVTVPSGLPVSAPVVLPVPQILDVSGIGAALSTGKAPSAQDPQLEYLIKSFLGRWQSYGPVSPTVDYFAPFTRALASQLNIRVTSSATVPPKSVLAPPKPFTRDLREGMTGNDVKALQQLLVANDAGPAARALARNGTTHLFGPLTKKALVEFQKQKGISPATGTFGPVTRSFVSK